MKSVEKGDLFCGSDCLVGRATLVDMFFFLGDAQKELSGSFWLIVPQQRVLLNP